MERLLDTKKLFPLLLGPTTFIFTLFFVQPEGMTPQAQAVLASTLWITIWWATEVVPIAVTSLLPLVLFPLTGALEMKPTASNYGHPLIFLFIGGFVLALSMEKWNLHKRIALNIIDAVGINTRMIILGFMLATGLLSMWISNTATTVMMLPIGLAIISQFRDFSLQNDEIRQNLDSFSKALMLCIAYSASVGGISTLVGTPTNIIFRGFVEEFYDVEISFAKWMLFATPISFVIIFISWFYITRFALPLKQLQIPSIKSEIRHQITLLGKISKEERAVLIVFLIVALAWITRSYLLNKIFPTINDSIIAIVGAIILFLIPSSKQGKMLMDWETANRLPWGVLLLFGAGFAVAAGFQSSGLAQWLGEQMSGLEGAPFILILLAITAMVNFMTEVSLNMATCTVMMPVLAALTPAINVHPYGLMMAATIAASCAFMLPVATAPNAIVFGSGLLRIKDMIRVGVVLNIISIILIVIYVYFALPPIWGLDLQAFPAEFAK